MPDPPNNLFYGDNLEILREYVDDESVDLVYLDPPFNSNQSYNVLFAEQDGTRAAAQIQAFEDTWRWDMGAAEAYRDVVEGGGDVSRALQAFKTLMGESDMLAYLAMMSPRLVELRRVLKPSGSIYLHCDPTASHYLKLLMDAVWGPERFVSEIVWKRVTAHSDAKRWSPDHDIILFYTNSGEFSWNPQFGPYSDEYIESKYRHVDPDGRRFQLDNITSPNPRPNLTYEWKGHAPPAKGWRYSRETMEELDAQGRIWYPDSKGKRPRLKRYLDEMPGVLLGEVWSDIFPINAMAQERLGYPTQKPQALLERIIGSSSNAGDVVLDPFCGCGTTIAAAQALGRRWIGIDITHLAINLIRHRLRDTYGDEIEDEFEVIGEPASVSGAEDLARRDRHQFEWWALSLVGARPIQTKKGADRGIDGRLYFHDADGKTKQIIISVKSGKPSVSYLRDLRGVIDREKARIGVMITLQEPTAPMRKEAASAGFYDSPVGSRHPCLQVLTIEELLEGGGIDYPRLTGGNVTVKRARRHKKARAQQLGAFDE